jgi:hypothetical protein
LRIETRALGSRDTDHELIWSAVALVTGAGAWLAFVWGLPLPWPACVFKGVTGWPCLTCGGTRAVRALLALDPASAWRLNPFVTAVLSGWAAYAVYGTGAVAGAWPRVKVSLASRECTVLRMGAAVCAAAAWIFLVVDGR